jgi:hypothetical protein
MLFRFGFARRTKLVRFPIISLLFTQPAHILIQSLRINRDAVELLAAVFGGGSGKVADGQIFQVTL